MHELQIKSASWKIKFELQKLKNELKIKVQEGGLRIYIFCMILIWICKKFFKATPIDDVIDKVSDKTTHPEGV